MDVPMKGSSKIRPLAAALILGTTMLGTAAVPPASPEQSAAGIVVEEVPRGSALLTAGLEPDDVIVGWELLPHPESPSEAERGELRTIFDWLWLELEKAPRGRVRLSVESRGETETLIVEPGPWTAEVRPRLPSELIGPYLRGRERVAAGRIADGVDVWEEILTDLTEAGPRVWLLDEIAQAWESVKHRDLAAGAHLRMLATDLPPPHRAMALHMIGRRMRRLSDPREEEIYREADELSRAVWGKNLIWAASRHQLAQCVWFARGALDISRALLADALRVREALAPRSADLAATLLWQAILLLEAHEFDLAESAAWRAQEILASKAPESSLQAFGLRVLGNLFRRRGETYLAIEYYEESLDIYQTVEPGIRVSENLTNLSAALEELGELDLAKGYLSQALEIQKRMDSRGPATGVSLIRLGLLAQQQDDLDRAEVFSRQALDIFPHGGPGKEVFHLQGKIAQKRGDPELAIRHFERALASGMKAGAVNKYLATCHHYLGDAFLGQGEWERAREHYLGALTIREKVAARSFPVAESLERLGTVAWRRGDPEQAARYFYRSIEVLEAQLNSLGASRDIGRRHREQFHGTYRGLITVLLELGRPEEAFTVLERARSQIFLAMLEERDLHLTGQHRELETERLELARRYDQTLSDMLRLEAAEDTERIAALARDLRALKQKRDALLFRIRQESPELAALRYPLPLDLEAVRESLDPGTVLLSYSVGDEHTGLFIVTPEKGLRLATVSAGMSELAGAVEDFRERIHSATQIASVSSLRRSAVEREAERLARLLIEPAAAEVSPAERLFIVPDGPLHLLPFGALRPAVGDQGARYLAEWKPFHLALSATVFGELRKDRKGSGPVSRPTVQLAAFGDPDYPSVREEPPEGRRAQVRVPELRVRSALRRSLFRPDPLPHTRREVEGIAELYPPTSRRVYLGPAATEERVKREGAAAQYLHFAVHGYYDDRFPLNSALALTLRKAPPEDGDNGLLQAWEIFESLRLDTDLVVLSACQTALGELRDGEGLVGLVRAFQYAGARTVAATLWSVDDRVTAELMVRFYRHLRNGSSKADALRAAQTELIHYPVEVRGVRGEVVHFDASSPYYWAAFQLYGDWR